MIIQKAKVQDAQEIFCLTQDTIRSTYANVYNKYEIDFFSALHSQEAIQEDIAKGNVYILSQGNKILATATVEDNHLMRVFVEKSHIGQGFGSQIMDFIEYKIAQNYDEIVLDTSLVAKNFYLHRGYVLTHSETLEIDNGRILEYEVMKKTLTEGKK